MPWYAYLAHFFGGVFLANALPRLIAGITGQRLQTPFASPPFKGLSSPSAVFATLPADGRSSARRGDMTAPSDGRSIGAMTATPAATTAALPKTLKWAAWLAFMYAALVIANTAVLQAMDHWVHGLTRAGAFVAIGVGLLRHARWAWLLGFGLSFYFLGFGIIDFGLWLAFRTRWLSTNLPHMSVSVTAVATALVAALLALLVHPRSRAAVRDAVATRP